MSWNDLQQIESDLTEALTSFNWQLAGAICQKLIIKIYQEPDVFPETAAIRLLSKLRRKRLFHSMSLLAEAIIRSGQNHAQVRRQYAQSLIDEGLLTGAELFLQAIIQDSSVSKAEETEARGLIGRIYKQLYINIDGNRNHKKRIFFERALNEYLYSYRLNRKNYWHGINVVALLKRGEKDGISLQGMPDADQLAQEILEFLKAKQDESSDAPSAFEVATNLEALIALNRYAEAFEKALDYSQCSDADVFEINSTLRQLTEVWQLNDKELPGSQIIPVLRAALLRGKGGEISLTSGESALELENINDIKRGFEKTGFEKIFGRDKTQTLEWYRNGLERAKSIARIETLDGKGLGTGWLVKKKDFYPDANGLMIITNAHVVSENSSDFGLHPSQVRVNFQELGHICYKTKIRWSSVQEKLDATLLSIEDEPPPQVEPLEIETNPVRMCEPPPRVYVIGHPGGRNLEFSLHDSHLIACNENLLHYRTPTEGGSSGSPVFEQTGWKVVALHHKGKCDMPRIDDKPGTYEANEGITLSAIKKAVQNGI
ncbi:MAG TPA: serine protease [Pyrinomonadaceae bacterium]|jgi:hypothetical protein